MTEQPKWTDLLGIDPDFTGGLSTDDYLTSMRCSRFEGCQLDKAKLALIRELCEIAWDCVTQDEGYEHKAVPVEHLLAVLNSVTPPNKEEGETS